MHNQRRSSTLPCAVEQFIISDKAVPTLASEELEKLSENIRVFIYARVSTADQAEKGYSLESQIDLCYEKAKSFGFQDSEILVLGEAGKSGDDPNRPALNFALSLMEKEVANGGKFICLHPDRFSRDSYQGSTVYRKIAGFGIDVHYIEVDFDPNNPESMFLYNIHLAVAQYNKAKILANSKRGRKTKLKKEEIPGVHKVFGYDFDTKTDKLVENPSEKQVYLLMVEWLIKGKDGKEMTASKIAKELAKLGYKPPVGDVWYQTTVSRILRSETYLGTFYFGKTEVVQRPNVSKQIIEKPRDEWFKIPVPAYIDRNTWEQVQKLLAKREKRHRGRPSLHHMLKGLARCGRCGGAVVAGGHSKTKNQHYYYYTCINKATKGWKACSGNASREPCRGKNWRTDIIDPIVWRWLFEHLQQPEKMIQEFVGGRGHPSIIQELKEKKTRLKSSHQNKDEERKKTLQQNRKGFISDDECEELMVVILKDIEAIKEELNLVTSALNTHTSNLDHSEMVKTRLQQYFQYMSAATKPSDELRREILGVFINKVILFDGKIEVYANWR